VWSLLHFAGRRRVRQLPDGLRIYAVGDVHGRADLLKEVLAGIDADLIGNPPSRALQVFLGDYIDRGPASREVIDLMIARQRTHEVVSLKGNHETYALQFIKDPAIFGDWRTLGGLATLMSYGLRPPLNPDDNEQRELAAQFAATIPESHLGFLATLRTSFSCGDFFFVHAGVRPGVPLALQSEDDLLSIREDFLLHEEDFGKLVVHGHTPVREPDLHANRINIDTGAFATGKLTCLIIEDGGLALLSTSPRWA
jgi:serine/threonine protein phosphatase 1